MISDSSRPTFRDDRIAVYGAGYFASPVVQDPRDPGATEQARAEGWFELQDIIRALEGGDFSPVDRLLACARAEGASEGLRAVAAEFLGHVGSPAVFIDMREELEAHPETRREGYNYDFRELVLAYCQGFTLWGRLDVVPVILDQYLTLRLKKGPYRTAPEIGALPLMMAELLEDDPSTMIAHEPPEDLLDDYLSLVLHRHEEVVAALGGERVHVFRGQLRSMEDLAKRMRFVEAYSVEVELGLLRRYFEPATGIDCTPIFTGGGPLAAAVIAEDFLSGPDLARFIPGERYFFGFPVP